MATDKEAIVAALVFAHVGWNRALGHEMGPFEPMLQQLEDENPDLWDELRSRDPAVTAPAARRWRELGPQRQMLILNKVWCVGCEVATTIVEPAGRIVRGDLVIEGTCLRCGGAVRRVIEGG